MPKVKGTKSLNKQVVIKAEVEVKPEKQVEVQADAEKQVEVKPKAEKQVEVKPEPEIFFDEEIVPKIVPYRIINCHFYQSGNCIKGENCTFIHGAKQTCLFINTPNGCRNGEKCPFSHDKPGPSNYKTQLCKTDKNGEVCRYGENCCFAHGKKELRFLKLF